MSTAPAQPLEVRDLRIAPGRRRREALIQGFFLTTAVFSILVSIAIVASLIGNAATFFFQVDKGLLVTDGWFPRRDMYDLATIFVGTLIIAGVAMLVATPLGLGAGIYLSEYATPRVRKIVKPII